MDEKRMEALKRAMVIRFGGFAVISAMVLYFFGRNYWQGWLYWAVLLVPMFLVVLYFLNRDPEFLERRMRYKEKEREQAAIIIFGIVILIAGIIVICLDLHYSWSIVPTGAVIAADALSLIGYIIIFLVFKENSYASRTIVVEEGQRVISSGPYAIVCHPMYLGYLMMMIAMPVALGSWAGVPIFSLYIPLIIARILNEEKVLARDLPGYAEYRMRTRYRLLPGIW
ncbi:MAG: Isoprenylcysteine carboxyl methyltransferase family protein [Euryarchaeota archaeon]|nr:Isoprenylcysteine carboxyl methyltransferase family protein [Euryarchaeota archaeon]